MADHGRTASRILGGGLLLSLAATFILLSQNNDQFLLAIFAMIVFAFALIALPAVLFVIRSFRPVATRPGTTRSMRSAVTISAVCLIGIGAVWIAELPSAVSWAIGGASMAFSILALVRVWRTAVTEGGPRLPFAGSVAAGGLFLFMAVVSIPKFACGCGEKAHVAALKSDLRNLVTAQEAFYADHLHYGTFTELDSAHAMYLSSGTEMVALEVLDTTAWNARVRHPLADQECGIWIGRPPADGMRNAREGEPKCWPAPAPAPAQSH